MKIAGELAVRFLRVKDAYMGACEEMQIAGATLAEARREHRDALTWIVQMNGESKVETPLRWNSDAARTVADKLQKLEGAHRGFSEAIGAQRAAVIALDAVMTEIRSALGEEAPSA